MTLKERWEVEQYRVKLTYEEWLEARITQLEEWLQSKEDTIAKLEKDNGELRRRIDYALKALGTRGIESDVIYVLRNG